MKKLILCIHLLLAVFFVSAQEKPEGLFINSKAPDFKLKDSTGKEISLRDVRRKGPVVIIFSRGSWCPYCTRRTRTLQDSLQYLQAKGAQVVVVTPEGEEGIAKTREKTGAHFPIVWDKDMSIAKGYGVLYKVDNQTLARLKNAEVDLLKINNQKEATLPVTAVYVLNTEGTVTYRFFDTDYKRGPSVQELANAAGRAF